MNKLPFIEKGRASRMEFNRKSGGSSPLFLGLYAGIVIIFLSITIIRLFQLTVVKGAYYETLAENNRVREIIIESPRGTIYDRKGMVVASNNKADASTSLERIISKRTYYEPESFSHVIGYRQTADSTDLKKDPCLNKLKNGDKTGKNGVEKLYECDLRGRNGKKLIEVDAHGKYKKTLDLVPPQNGTDIHLAIDSLLQKKAYELMKNKKGAVVGLKPKTGEVLILLSSPSFNPQVFEDEDAKIAAANFRDPDKPMYDRAVEGTYPPGSVFKPFIVAAGIEEKAVTVKTIFEDKGVLKAGAQEFHNWYYLEYGKVEGEVDVFKALQRSNDIYFYNLGGKLGPEKIKKWAELFGFQNKTDIGLPESEGIVPSSFWKEDVLGEQWYLGDTYNLSIGQGYLAVSPLQMAQGTAAFANNGNVCKPLLLKVGTPLAGKPVCRKVPMSENTYKIVREGMKQACETGGTGWPFFDFGIEATRSASLDAKDASQRTSVKTKVQVGCKTGTAESHAKSGKPHAWFTVFAPFDEPEILLTVLVEEGGQGSDVAAPIAKEILKMYFERME